MAEYANARVLIYDDPDEMRDEFCRHLVELGADALGRHGRFSLALTGGRTPEVFYQRLAELPYRDALDWSAVSIFFGDERCVPPDDDMANYRLAYDAWLKDGPVHQENIHRLEGEAEDLNAAAARYDEVLERELNVSTMGVPALDLILLGMGTDGHVASLFPGTEALQVRNRHIVPNYVARLDAWRLTFTFPLINAARNVWMLVTGAEKSEMVARALGHLPGGNVLPVWHVRPVDGKLSWWLDSDAAAEIPPEEQDRPEGELDA